MGKLLVIKNVDFSTNRVDKVDPVLDYDNLINPSTLQWSKYFNANGEVKNGDPTYAVSDYIELDGNNLSFAGVSPYGSTSSVKAIAVYNSSKQLLRVFSEEGVRHYAYQTGDYYIRFTLYQPVIANSTYKYYIPGYPAFFACYGDRLLPYKAYGT